MYTIASVLKVACAFNSYSKATVLLHGLIIPSCSQRFLRKLPGGIFGEQAEDRLFEIIQMDNPDEQRRQIQRWRILACCTTCSIVQFSQCTAIALFVSKVLPYPCRLSEHWYLEIHVCFIATVSGQNFRISCNLSGAQVPFPDVGNDPVCWIYLLNLKVLVDTGRLQSHCLIKQSGAATMADFSYGTFNILRVQHLAEGCTATPSLVFLQYYAGSYNSSTFVHAPLPFAMR